MTKAIIFILICTVGFVAGWVMGQKTGLDMAIDMLIASGVAEMEDTDAEN